MEFLDGVTPLLVTHDDIDNIARTLAPLGWARRIVVIDGGSTDGTLDVLDKDPRIEVHHRAFDSFAGQCNFGLSKIETDWVLSLDADHEIGEALTSELRSLWPSQAHHGFRASFVHRVYGRALHGSLHRPRTVLYRLKSGRYETEGQRHRVRISGDVETLRAPIYHDDRRPLAHWLWSQRKYAEREAARLLEMPRGRLSWMEKIRRMGWPAPILVFPYVLFGKGVLLDGLAGWLYALQCLFAEVLLALQLLDRRLSARQR
jgi:glycosyltransferase involved in cell wall biosynthesis